MHFSLKLLSQILLSKITSIADVLHFLNKFNSKIQKLQIIKPSDDQLILCQNALQL